VDAEERFRRPELDRTQPIRSWTTLLAALAPSTGQRDAGAGTTGRDASSLNDVVSHSVELGYRVIDEYVRQGQKTAQRFNDRSYGADAMTNDFQDLSTRMAQYAADFAALWFEFMQLAAAGGTGRPAAAPANGVGTSAPAGPPRERAGSPATAAEPDRAEPTRVRVAVSSPYPAEVSVDVRPHVTARRLVVQSLRAIEPEKPRLTDVAVDDASGDDPVTLRICVPAGQPAGVYNALIIDEDTGRPAGTLSVRISRE
jgi:hypothetical protein